MPEPFFISVIHFFTGSLTLASGFFAMLSVKGSRFHRWSGWCFVFLMSLLVLTGLWMSVSREVVFTVLLSLLTAYSFMTGWAAASSKKLARVITQISPLISLTIFIGAIFAGVHAKTTESGLLNGLPTTAFYMIAVVALLSNIFDVRYLCFIKPELTTRLIRHTWRMGFSLFIATVIFFFGNNHVLPDHFRTTFYLSMPVLLVVVLTASYCLFIAFNSARVPHHRMKLREKMTK